MISIHTIKLVSIGACLGVVLTACSSDSNTTAGTEVHVHITHEPAPATVTVTATPGKQFTAGSTGTTIEITTAYLTVAEMDLRQDCVASPFAKAMGSLLDMLVPVAHAHTESTPTSIGAPYVLDIMQDDATDEVEFGDFSPAAGTYCGVTVHLESADIDARNLPPMAFSVVAHIAGNYNAGAGDVAFSIDISLHEHTDIDLLPDVVLDATNLAEEVHLNVEYNTWFDGIDMTNLASEESAVLDNILASIEQH